MAQLSFNIVLYPMGIPPLYGINGYAVNQKAEMQVIARCQACFTGIADYLTLAYRLTNGHRDTAQMTVEGAEALAMIDEDRFSIDSEILRENDPPGVGCLDWRAGQRGEINAQVYGSIQYLALVIVNPLIAE